MSRKRKKDLLLSSTERTEECQHTKSENMYYVRVSHWAPEVVIDALECSTRSSVFNTSMMIRRKKRAEIGGSPQVIYHDSSNIQYLMIRFV